MISRIIKDVKITLGGLFGQAPTIEVKEVGLPSSQTPTISFNTDSANSYADPRWAFSNKGTSGDAYRVDGGEETQGVTFQNGFTGLRYKADQPAMVSPTSKVQMYIPAGVGSPNHWTINTNVPSNNHTSVAFGVGPSFLENGVLVAVASSSTDFMRSTDGGLTWTSVTTGLASANWNSVAYGNGIFVAVSGTGSPSLQRAARSIDGGITWTISTTPVDLNWKSVTFGGAGLFVAVASDAATNNIMTSPDGVTWTSRTAPNTNSLNSVCWGNNLYVAVASSGTGNRVTTSSNGITWTARTSAADQAWQAVCWGKGLFVAVSDSGTNKVMTSIDGITWTLRETPASAGLGAVSYGDGVFVALGNVSTGARFLASTDGIFWSVKPISLGPTYRSVCYNPIAARFVAVSSGSARQVHTLPNAYVLPTGTRNGQKVTVISTIEPMDSYSTVRVKNKNGEGELGFIPVTPSEPAEFVWDQSRTAWILMNPRKSTSNASSWFPARPPLNVNTGFSSVTYGRGRYVAVPVASTSPFAYSDNGIDWENTTAPSTAVYKSVCHGYISARGLASLFVAVANSGSFRAAYSYDGVNWFSASAAAQNNWTSVCWGLQNGNSNAPIFVAVAASGTGNRVMTSFDGINWTTRTSAADNNWNSVCWGNGLFVAVAASGTGNRVMTSRDGITWTIRTSPADNSWISVCYGNGLFVAVAAFSSVANTRIMTSPDGVTWTLRTNPVDNLWASVTYANGLFVAVAASGTNDRVMVSNNGINWYSRQNIVDIPFSSVCFGNSGGFVAVSDTPTANPIIVSKV